jgi:type II secretory pathway pseudopilin PulG
MNNSHRKYKGYSLLELLTIVAIMGILLTAFMVSLDKSSSDAKLISAQREVASAIKTAKSYALQGKTNAAGNVPGYWGIKFTDTSTYVIFHSANTAGGGHTTKETYTLKNGVVLSSPVLSVGPPNNTAIYFDVPNGQAVLPTSPTFDIALQLGTLPAKTITTNSGGVITEN